MENVHFESLYPSDSRSKEIEKLLIFVKEGNSCQVVSLPGAGRSNLFGLLSYNRNIRTKHLGENQKWFHFVAVNLTEVRKKPLSDVTKFLFLSLVDSLRERKMDEEYQKTNEFFKEAVGLNDELVLFQGLKKTIDLLAIEKELTVVFLFDRFEEYIPMLIPEFFANLRVLRSRAKYRFSVVFSLNRPLEDIVEPLLFSDFSDFLAGHTIYLPLLDTPSLTFRLFYIEKITGKKLEKTTLDTILKLTAGHGKLTRVCAEAILNNETIKQSNNNLTEFLLSQNQVWDALGEIWTSLMPHEQSALAQDHESGLRPELRPREIMNQEKELSYLENVGLLKDEAITIPLFTEFIKQRFLSTMKQLNNETIAYDSQTKEIKKGTIVISDLLSSQEYRLLRFFIQSGNRVVEREEIITSVWPESKNAQGISDQAIDQLIFRLRHKIEDDPNTPTHLQTIKGRGFRFTP